tara:strand:- start:485 stop:1954 length:1470 start_codon:yes stop_codon:yes gene_type:complete
MRQVDYVSTTALTPINPYTQHGGGGFKKIVSVAAVIAIPIAAPIVASAVAGSMGIASLGMAGMIGGSALAGGLMGAAVGSYTGQGMKQGAMMGALSGGLSGYMAGRPPAGGPVDPGMTASGPETMYSDAATVGASPDGTGMSTYGMDRVPADVQAPATFTSPSGPGDMGAQTLGDKLSTSGVQTDYSGQPIQYPQGQNFSAPNVNTGPSPTYGMDRVPSAYGPDPAATSGLSPTYGMDRVPSTVPGGGPNYPAAPTPPAPQPNLFQQTGAEIANRFTDPKTLADVSIQAGVNLIGAELMGVGDMSDEEKENLRLQKEQMERLKERDEKAYNFAMSQAKRFLQLGEDFDPEQIARQAYGKATQRAGIAKRQALAKIDPRRAGLRAAEERRFNLGAAANTGSAYDRGMIQGLNQQANYLQKASSTFPNQGGSYSAALTGLQQTQANLARKRSEAQKGVNQMFGGFLTRPGDGNDDYRAGLRDGYNAMFKGV